MGKVPDSLKHEFKTKNGRKVFDGGGIEPDVKMDDVEMSLLSQQLFIKGILFEFTTQYKINHPTIAAAKDFRLTDADFDEFVKFAGTKNFEHQSESEKALSDLKKEAEKEKYFDDFKTQFENLQAKLNHDKKDDLYHNKTEIKELLENEIVSRYYFQKGRTEADFNNDPNILKAVSILKDKAAYESLLVMKK